MNRLDNRCNCYDACSIAKYLVLAFEGKEESSQSKLSELVPAKTQVYSRHIDWCFGLAVSAVGSVSENTSHRNHGCTVPYRKQTINPFSIFCII